MVKRVLRGRVLRFLSEPQGIDDTGSYAYDEDGAVLVEAGLVVSVGPAAGVLAEAGAGAEIVDHRPHLHHARVHRHAYPYAADAGDRLLWGAAARLAEHLHLSEEQNSADPAHAARIAGRFLDELLRHGTTTAVAYLLGASAIGRGLFRGGRSAQHADDRRQGDDGPQRARGAARHAAVGL